MGLRESGVLIRTMDDGEVTKQATVSCSHCGCIMQADDSHTRWCFKCCKLTCSKKRCSEKCVPYEQQIENIERGFDAIRSTMKVGGW